MAIIMLSSSLISQVHPLQLEPGLRTSKRIFLCQQGAPERRTSRLPHSGLPQPDFFDSGAHPSTGTSKSGHSIAAPGDLVSSCSITDTESAGRPPHASSECATKPHVPHKVRYQSRPQGAALGSLRFTCVERFLSALECPYL